MNQETTNLLMTTVVLPLLVALVSFEIAYLKKKTIEITSHIENRTTADNICSASESVMQAVRATAQTYVDSLKKSGDFN
ncbi:MAG: hypothetical protein A2Y17_05610 [Clostridiales bacterium GWF2_38_85]|nr:MAG: hypothetical protein A2Y17_05610 [Clostridiales bacterium GWF2_38_85]HBL84042.1 hypothetical protein [Clostridiales bacterium]